MGTIIQSYGPIYGEVVNGTVQGRPNGSIFVPITNTIEIIAPEGMTIARTDLGHPTRIFTSDYFDVSAKSQDLASNIRLSLYTDEECTTPFGTPINLAAGDFNNVDRRRLGYSDSDPTPGESYYLRAELINNNTPVAVSDTVIVEGA